MSKLDELMVVAPDGTIVGFFDEDGLLHPLGNLGALFE